MENKAFSAGDDDGEAQTKEIKFTTKKNFNALLLTFDVCIVIILWSSRTFTRSTSYSWPLVSCDGSFREDSNSEGDDDPAFLTLLRS